MKKASANVPNSTDTCSRQTEIPFGEKIICVKSRRHSQPCVTRKGGENNGVSLRNLAELRNKVGPGENDGRSEVEFAKPQDQKPNDKPTRNAVIAALAAEYANWMLLQRKIRKLALESGASVRNQLWLTGEMSD